MRFDLRSDALYPATACKNRHSNGNPPHSCAKQRNGQFHAHRGRRQEPSPANFKTLSSTKIFLSGVGKAELLLLQFL